MQPKLYMTINDIQKETPAPKEFRNNKNKQWREKWVAAKFCQAFDWTDALIASPTEDKGDDIFIKYNNNLYPFQIAEIAPRDPLTTKTLPSPKENENGFISCEIYGSLSPQITTLVTSLIEKKNKINYAHQENMNLLIYLNPPGAIILDAEIDIDISAIAEQTKASQFKTICLYENGNVSFIKGNVYSLAHI